MIRVRDDDVLVPSSGGDSFDRFKRVHDLIVSKNALHVPAILTTEVQQFPEAIQFIRVEYEAGRMEPQWHGMIHVNYGEKSYEIIVREIVASQEFFRDSFGVEFSIFYTPWGANGSHIKAACEDNLITMIDCSKLIRCVHVNREPDKFRGKDIELMIHWYEGTDRLEAALRSLQ